MDPLAERALAAPDDVASLMEEAFDLIIGEVFFALNGLTAEPIVRPEIDARCRTTLHRLKCQTWGQLASHTVGQIWNVPNAGRLTVNRILTAAARRNFDEATQPGSTAVWRQGGQAAPVAHSPTIERIDRMLQMLAAWAIRERGATHLGDLLVLASDLGRVPIELSAACASISDVALTEIVGEGGALLPRDLLQQLVNEIEPRSDIVVARRVRLGTRPTLEHLGLNLGVSRERVRQLEAKALKSLQRATRAPQFAPLRWRAADLRDLLGVAAVESSDFVRDLLTHAVHGLDDPASCSAIELILWLAGPYHREGDWLISSDRTLEDLKRAFDIALSDRSIVTHDTIENVLQDLGVRPPMATAFLHECSNWRQLDACTHVRWAGSVGDKADTVLRIVGHPLGVEAINNYIGEGHAASSLRNALAADHRFIRLDKANNYGLREWGLEEYSGISQEIIERIERAGGCVDLEEVVSELVERFGVSANSVRMYAGSPAFLIKAGQIALRPDDVPYVSNARIDRACGTYALPDGRVIVHDTVDRDVLRGSGRPLPEAAAYAIGLRPGDRATFEFGGDTHIVVSWPATAVMGPSLGSVRQVAEKLDLATDEPFRLTFDPLARSCAASAVDHESIQGLTGVPVRVGHEVEDLAVAVGVEPRLLRSTLQERGDNAVLGLLPPTQQPADLTEAISTFGDLLTD